MSVSTEESNIETAGTRSETTLVMNGTGQRAEVVDATEINREDTSFCGSCISTLIFIFSAILILFTFPFSLCFCIKIVQEYERAIIFRLGRVKRGGPVGPGLFFIVPCMDQVQ